MHFLFIPYGMKEWVDKTLRDMSAQKFPIKFSKAGHPDVNLLIESQMRILPFGIYDYVFPKESLDVVLTTLLESNFNLKDDVYEGVGKFKTYMLRKMLHADKIPEFKRDNKFPWIKENVAIIPIGIKHDGEIEEPAHHLHPGYKHERI